MAVLDSSRQALSIDPLSGSIGILRKVIQQKLHLGFPSSNRQMLTSWPALNFQKPECQHCQPGQHCSALPTEEGAIMYISRISFRVYAAISTSEYTLNRSCYKAVGKAILYFDTLESTLWHQRKSPEYYKMHKISILYIN